MTTINNLSAIDSVSSGDQLPVFDVSNGDARKMSVSQLQAFFTANFASPQFDVTISSPIAGFNQVLAATSKSIWLLLTPAGTLATGTVTLPPVADCFDGQEVLVTSSAQITALTVAGNGATVNGAPGSIIANGAFRMRYNLLLTSWYVVSLNAVDSFVDLTVTGDILDENGNVILAFDPQASAVNSVSIANSATGSSPTIEAVGSDTDIGISITAKGGGGIAMTADSFLLSGTTTTVSGVLDVGGNANVTGNVISDAIVEGGTLVRSGGPLLSFGYTVATLPAAASIVGGRAFVTDSNAALTAGIGATVAGGGSNFVPVFSNGLNWLIG